MLAINLLELFNRFPWILLGVEQIESLIVEPVGGLIRKRLLFLAEKIEAAARTEATRE
jgi:hypothetical protein